MTTLTASKQNASAIAVLHTAITSWATAMRARRTERQAISAMKGLNRSTLRDIGIDRSEIASIIHTQPHGGRKTYDRN